MKFINIRDYQGGEFAIGRIWNGKKDLLQQICDWDNVDCLEDEEVRLFFQEQKKWKAQELADYMSETWQIKVIPLRELSKEDREELKDDIHDFR